LGSGNGWILKLYSESVPRPFGTAMAEEAFQMGLIPSDTDFRMFRDYADIPGLDISIVKNGWVYHTKFDKIQEIPPGCIQHVGSNALALAESFGNLDYSEIKLSDGKMVFFDCFGLFMIVYSEIGGMIINVLVTLLTIAVIAWYEGRLMNWKL
jgi:Zn-dependent M28 family amino/carboxypeptidase